MPMVILTALYDWVIGLLGRPLRPNHHRQIQCWNNTTPAYNCTTRKVGLHFRVNLAEHAMCTNIFWEQWAKRTALMEQEEDPLEHYLAEFARWLLTDPTLYQEAAQTIRMLLMQGSTLSYFPITASQSVPSEPDSSRAYKYHKLLISSPLILMPQHHMVDCSVSTWQAGLVLFFTVTQVPDIELLIAEAATNTS